MFKNRGITYKLIFFILNGTLVIFIVLLIAQYTITRRLLLKNAEEIARNLAYRAVYRIESKLYPIETVPRNIVPMLKNIGYKKDNLIDVIGLMVKNNRDIYGSTIAFEPYAFDKTQKYFAPYYYKGKEGLRFSYLGGRDYDYFNMDWYTRPKAALKPVWSKPYFDEGGGNILMTTYSVPIFRPDNGKFWAVMTADVTLEWLNEIVSSIKIFKSGYGFLVSHDGTFITHPDKGLVMHKTVNELAEKHGSEILKKTSKDMIDGKSGFVYIDKLNNKEGLWLFYAPLPSEGWSLCVVFPIDELESDVRGLTKTVFFIGVFGITILSILIAISASSIIRPLRGLADAARKIGGGDLDTEITAPRNRDEAGLLADALIYLKVSLKEYIENLTVTTKAKERIESELNIAREIQLGILPKIFPPFPDREEFEIYTSMKAAKEVGGDFYDFFFMDNTHLCFVIGDVSGKGVPASLFMAVTKTLIKACADIATMPDEILGKVNKELSSENDSMMFVTVFCGIFNTVTRELIYTSAGHNPPYRYCSADGGIVELTAEGVALGVMEEGFTLERKNVILDKGDIITLYTDGVTEAVNVSMEEFGEERLKAIIHGNIDVSAIRLVESINRNVEDFAAGMAQYDDITLMVLKIH